MDWQLGKGEVKGLKASVFSRACSPYTVAEEGKSTSEGEAQMKRPEKN